MKVCRKKNFFEKATFERRNVRIEDILPPDRSDDGGRYATNAEGNGLADGLTDGTVGAAGGSAEEIKSRAAYFLVNGAPELSLNAEADGKYALLFGETDFGAAKEAGFREVPARVYRFLKREAEEFVLVERIKAGGLGAMDEAYAMRRLSEEFKKTQEQIAVLTRKSRSAVANTLRLLTLEPEVIGLVESGRLSAGHARALVRVPKDKQYPFASETVKRGASVRETERAVKAYLTPPEVLQSEKAAVAAAKSAELKVLVERMRRTLGAKVSLIGNDKKGRIYIDYYSAEELYRLEEYLDVIDKFTGRD